VVVPELDALPAMTAALEAGLRGIDLNHMPVEVSVTATDQAGPPELTPLACACAAGGVVVGIAVRPVYRDAQTGAVFPVVLQLLRRQLAVAVRKAVFAFTGKRGKLRHGHYESLGPSALVKAARLVDQQLCEAAQSFDFV